MSVSIVTYLFDFYCSAAGSDLFLNKPKLLICTVKLALNVYFSEHHTELGKINCLLLFLSIKTHCSEQKSLADAGE